MGANGGYAAAFVGVGGRVAWLHDRGGGRGAQRRVGGRQDAAEVVLAYKDVRCEDDRVEDVEDNLVERERRVLQALRRWGSG